MNTGTQRVSYNSVQQKKSPQTGIAFTNNYSILVIVEYTREGSSGVPFVSQCLIDPRVQDGGAKHKGEASSTHGRRELQAAPAETAVAQGHSCIDGDGLGQNAEHDCEEGVANQPQLHLPACCQAPSGGQSCDIIPRAAEEPSLTITGS